MATSRKDDNDGDPWRGRGGLPPDIEDILRGGRGRLVRMLPGGGPRTTLLVAALLVFGGVCWTAYYTVPSDSVAVVQRFGRSQAAHSV